MPGYLGVEFAGDASFGMTISYWKDEASIKSWREHPRHREIQRKGFEVWYSEYTTRVAKVERLGGIKRPKAP
jgi:heme-degrading monooxygenase HmoA